MKVIVCGAGQVGFNIARYLALEGNDVVVVDQSQELIRKITDTLDVQGIVGHASHPDILERAGAADTDMLVAVTHADEINMVACQVAHSLFNVPTKIARVRHQSYLQPHWSNLFSRDHMPIDVIISPEAEVARAILRRLRLPGAMDTISLVEDRVKVVAVRVEESCPLIRTPLRKLVQLFPDLNVAIIGIIREDRPVAPSGDEQILPGDQVYFVADSKHVTRAMVAFGHEETEARRVVIFGGGNIGLFLAQELERHHPTVSAKLIEVDKERAEEVARALQRVVVLHGDALEGEILREAGVPACETAVAVTNDDETNILASLLAKASGCRRSLTLINKMTYGPLMGTLGVDVWVNPRSITVSTILQHVRRGRIRAVHSLREDFGEVIEADALETSTLVGTPLREINLPSGVMIGAVVREDRVIIPRGSTVIHPNDRVVLFAAAEAVRKVEKMFAVRLEYF